VKGGAHGILNNMYAGCNAELSISSSRNILAERKSFVALPRATLLYTFLAFPFAEKGYLQPLNFFSAHHIKIKELLYLHRFAFANTQLLSVSLMNISIEFGSRK